jgi:hypothetical protein
MEVGILATGGKGSFYCGMCPTTGRPWLETDALDLERLAEFVD